MEFIKTSKEGHVAIVTMSHAPINVLSFEMLDEMSDWYSFAAVNAGDVPLEIWASRIDDKTFIVHSMASADGEMDFETLVMEYQVYYGFIGCSIVFTLALASLVLFILWLVKKRRYN